MVVKKSSKRAENPIPAEVAGRVRDRFVACFYCGEPAKVEGWDLQVTPLQIEHVVPLHRGGTSDESNLVMACRSCNTSKGSKTVIEYVQYTLYPQLAVATAAEPLPGAWLTKPDSGIASRKPKQRCTK